MRQVGGKVLGEGSYGCAFKPVPRCADGTRYTHVGNLPAIGKITFQDDDELKVGQQIMKLPLAANYFALPTKSCKPAMPVDDPDTCELLEDYEDDGLIDMLVMPDGGKSLQYYSKDTATLADNYVRIFKHLLEGMVIYQDAGYIHNDIHLGNILVDKHNVARFIDFGLTFRPVEVTTMRSARMSEMFKTKASWAPPEIYIWRLLTNIKEVGGQIPGLIQKIIESNSDYKYLERSFPMREPTAKTMAALVPFLTPLVNKKDFGSFVRQYGGRMDAWRLGMALWDVYLKIRQASILPGSSLKNHPLLKKEKAVFHILEGLTEIDVRKRWDAKKALSHFG